MIIYNLCLIILPETTGTTFIQDYCGSPDILDTFESGCLTRNTEITNFYEKIGMSVRKERKTSQSIDRVKTKISSPILLIEDSDILSDIVSYRLLEKLDVEIHVAKTYAEAKQLLKLHRRKYLVAICDLGLPDAKDGESLQLVAKAGVKAIALTGMSDKSHWQNLSKDLLVDFVVKDTPNAINYTVDLVGRLFKNQFIKALVVEDSTSELRILENVLLLLNFQVNVAQDGLEAIEILKRDKDIRLMITDYEMPRMNGIELVNKARGIIDKNALAIIGISASGKNDIGTMFIKNGANDFLNKPYSLDELVCRVNMNMAALENIDYIFELANRDALTSLFNRRYFFSNIVQLQNLNRESGQEIACAMIDIDYFKSVNDTYGHDCGDEVLRIFSRLLCEHFDTELCARLGGEEFAIVFSGIAHEQLFEKLESFRKEVSSTKIEWEDDSISFTVSIGVCAKVNMDYEEMLNLADKYLYEAKTQGRNQVVLRN